MGVEMRLFGGFEDRRSSKFGTSKHQKFNHELTRTSNLYLLTSEPTNINDPNPLPAN